MKIETLSLEQLALIPQVRDEWLKIAMDTAPVDRARVREIFGRLYTLANKPVPKHIIHLDSPLQVSKAIAKMRSENSSVSQEVSQEVSDQVSREVRIMRIPQTIGQVFSVLNTFAKFTEVSKEVSDQVFNQVGLPVGSQMNRVYGRVQAAIKDQADVVTDWEEDFGQCDHSMPSCDFFGRIGIDVSKLEPAFDLAKNCGWSVLYWDWAFISAKPEYIKRDEQNLLHCEIGPAVRYPDGFSVFAIHGVRR